MTEAAFISQVRDEITISGSLPDRLPEDEYRRIIRQSTKWFGDNWDNAVESVYAVIPKTQLQNNSKFMQDRRISVPKDIVAITDFREIKGHNTISVDKDFSYDKLIASELLLSSPLGDDLVMRTATSNFYDLTKYFTISEISFEYNQNTNEITVKGRDPKYDLLIVMAAIISPDRLYEDYYFTRYVTCLAKISYARLVGLHDLKLIGGIPVNGDMLRTEGETELEQIKEEMRGKQPPSYFLTVH